MRNLLVPFGIKPKIRVENPYAGPYARSVTVAIDVMPLMLLLAGFMDRVMLKIYEFYGQTPLIYRQMPADFAGIGQLLWEVRYPWFVHNIMAVLIIGVPYVACQIMFGTTPGRWLLGLKVVRRTTHEPIDPWRYVLRYMAYIITIAPIGLIWANFNKERRAWHDYVADTVVLNMRPNGWYWQHFKRLCKRLMGKTDSGPMEQPVSEPPAEQRHGDGEKPVQ